MASACFVSARSYQALFVTCNNHNTSRHPKHQPLEPQSQHLLTLNGRHSEWHIHLTFASVSPCHLVRWKTRRDTERSESQLKIPWMNWLLYPSISPFFSVAIQLIRMSQEGVTESFRLRDRKWQNPRRELCWVECTSFCPQLWGNICGKSHRLILIWCVYIVWYRYNIYNDIEHI